MGPVEARGAVDGARTGYFHSHRTANRQTGARAAAGPPRSLKAVDLVKMPKLGAFALIMLRMNRNRGAGHAGATSLNAQNWGPAIEKRQASPLAKTQLAAVSSAPSQKSWSVSSSGPRLTGLPRMDDERGLVQLNLLVWRSQEVCAPTAPGNRNKTS